MLKNLNTLKIYGLPRSGTNYLQFMLVNNFKVKVLLLDHGWKHDRIVSSLPSIAIVKNPFSWLVSMYLFSKLRCGMFHLPQEITFSDYIRYPFIWDTDVAGKGSRLVYQTFVNPIHYWNDMNCHWQEKANLCVKYEDLLVGFDCLDKISKCFGFHFKNCVFPDSYIAPGKANDVSSSPQQNFSQRDYSVYYSDLDLDFVKQHLSLGLLDSFGYAHL
jgi:hypothetical protein